MGNNFNCNSSTKNVIRYNSRSKCAQTCSEQCDQSAVWRCPRFRATNPISIKLPPKDIPLVFPLYVEGLSQFDEWKARCLNRCFTNWTYKAMTRTLPSGKLDFDPHMTVDMSRKTVQRIWQCRVQSQGFCTLNRRFWISQWLEPMEEIGKAFCESEHVVSTPSKAAWWAK